MKETSQKLFDAISEISASQDEANILLCKILDPRNAFYHLIKPEYRNLIAILRELFSESGNDQAVFQQLKKAGFRDCTIGLILVIHLGSTETKKFLDSVLGSYEGEKFFERYVEGQLCQE